MRKAVAAPDARGHTSLHAAVHSMPRGSYENVWLLALLAGACRWGAGTGVKQAGGRGARRRGCSAPSRWSRCGRPRKLIRTRQCWRGCGQ